MARSMNVGDYDLGISTENDIDDVSGESEFPQEGIQINETTDDDSLETIENALESPKVHSHIVNTSDLGRQMEGYIIAHDYKYELCVWHEKELCESLLQQDLDAKILHQYELAWGEE